MALKIKSLQEITMDRNNLPSRNLLSGFTVVYSCSVFLIYNSRTIVPVRVHFQTDTHFDITVCRKVCKKQLSRCCFLGLFSICIVSPIFSQSNSLAGCQSICRCYGKVSLKSHLCPYTTLWCAFGSFMLVCDWLEHCEARDSLPSAAARSALSNFKSISVLDLRDER